MCPGGDLPGAVFCETVMNPPFRRLPDYETTRRRQQALQEWREALGEVADVELDINVLTFYIEPGPQSVANMFKVARLLHRANVVLGVDEIRIKF